MKNRPILLTIFFLQLCFLSAMIFYHQAQLKDSQKILLKTVPYDPKSIFRGYYASLNYEISSLPISLLKDIALSELENTSELFVLLVKEGDYWQAKAVFKKPPKDDGIYLRGRLANDSYSTLKYPALRSRKNIFLEYGIESFFLSESHSTEVDTYNREARLSSKQIEEERKKRIGELDEETRRIDKDRISLWVDELNEEMELWLKDGIINQSQKDKLQNKYANAMHKIEGIEDSLSQSSSSRQIPIIVEVAIDRKHYGHPVRLLLKGKEYK